MRGDFFQQQKGDVMTPVRASTIKGVLIGNMGYTADEAEQAIAAGKLDAVAFGTGFLANPDLPARIKAGAPLNPPDPATFYTPGAGGLYGLSGAGRGSRRRLTRPQSAARWPAFHRP